MAITVIGWIGTVPAHAQRLPTGQQLLPAGKSIQLPGTMPMGIAQVPGSSRVVVVCSGTLQSLATVDPAGGAVISHIDYQALGGTEYRPTGSVYYGQAIHGNTLYAARGSEDAVGIYQIGADGSLTQTGTLDDSDTQSGVNFPAGVAVDGAGARLYAANNMADTVSIFDLAAGKLLGSVPVGGYPLAVAALPDGSRVYVSSERDGIVSVVDPVKRVRLADIPTGSHPDALLLSRDARWLLVGNGDSDTVSVMDTRDNHVAATTLLRPSDTRGLPGATPTGLALSPDQRTLYVSLADMNAVAVLRFDPERGHADMLGYIPAGWYPTAVAVSADGGSLLIANGKGSTPRNPNPQGPSPLSYSNQFKDHNILFGTVSVIRLPFANLADSTRQVLAACGLNHSLDPDADAVAKRLAGLPIKHVIYIIKENRTYDQVLGDVATGNGDPSLALFGNNITPNEHALAQHFLLLDNFYCCAEVSPDGWNWSTSGLAEEYTQRTVPENYSERRRSSRPAVRTYDYEGENRDVAVSMKGQPDVAESPGGYIWDDCAAHNVDYRNYGCFLGFEDHKPDKPALAGGQTDPSFAPFDMHFPDSDAYAVHNLDSPGLETYGPSGATSRFAAWKSEFDGFVRNGDMPTFEIVRLPRDHTAGTTPMLNTPQAMAADNDYAVGEIVDALSHSPYWASSAVFVIEDDAQDGPDHVDCHRSTAYVISPFIPRGTVDHAFYNTDSVLRTMEALMHLPPMTRYDAVAPPIRDFAATLDPSPYNAILPDLAILNQKNTSRSYGAARSRTFDFAVADDAPDDSLNRILWYSIKGPSTPYPGIHAVFGSQPSTRH